MMDYHKLAYLTYKRIGKKKRSAKFKSLTRFERRHFSGLHFSKGEQLLSFLLYLLSYVFGDMFVLKYLEYLEISHEKIPQLIKEDKLHSKTLGQVSPYYVMSVTYGLSDGIVEVLSAVSGISAFVKGTNLLLAGIIIGLSGSISMGVGAYMSYNNKRSGKYALLTGLSYFISAIFVTVPFMFKGGIIMALVIRGIISFFNGYLRGIFEMKSPLKRGVEYSLLTLFTAIVVREIGVLLNRSFLHNII
jgi:hypothetical protein